nr:MADS-box protein SOC1-like [Ipomoea batatas]
MIVKVIDSLEYNEITPWPEEGFIVIKLLGEGLDSCSIDDLYQIQEQLAISLRNIRARKEKILEEENAELKKTCDVQLRLHLSEEDDEPQRPYTDVETRLFIGLPETTIPLATGRAQ